MASTEDRLEAHSAMLVSGLTRIFGDFNPEMLQQVLPRVEWIELGGGELLFRQHDQDESLFFVVSGRLRAFTLDAGGRRKVLGEIARGETVGEMAFFTGEPRTASVAAVRDSVLARFSKEVFRELLLAYPLVSLNMTRLVIERLERSSHARQAVSKPVTLGILAITRQVDQQEFARELAARLGRYGKTFVLTSQKVDEMLGQPGAAQAPLQQAELSRRVTVMLEQIEIEHQFVLFVADATATEWTRRCTRHCDELLLVADADEASDLHRIEREYLPSSGDERERGAVSQRLVLLHPPDRQSPSDTRRWLEPRVLAGHVHLRRDLARDWQRLGRLVSGNAVGLVLSGGGARGFAHLGVMRALEEAGISVDLAAGTSVGAVMAAYAAMDLPTAQIIAAARKAFSANPTGDFNLVPLLSLIRGRRLKRVIDSAIVDSCGQHIGIEDLWKGYFCVSSNYSTAREAVLSQGPLAKSIRASVSIPGALPPVILDGELHVDGGSFNNFPTDVMARRGAARIIGVNLLREREVKYELEEVPGWFELLRDRLRGSRRRHQLPSLTSLMLNSSLMYSHARQQQSQDEVDLHFAPGVEQYGMLEWSKFDQIVDIGYQHGKRRLAQVDPAQLEPLRYP